MFSLKNDPEAKKILEEMQNSIKHINEHLTGMQRVLTVQNPYYSGSGSLFSVPLQANLPAQVLQHETSLKVQDSMEESQKMLTLSSTRYFGSGSPFSASPQTNLSRQKSQDDSSLEKISSLQISDSSSFGSCS